MVHKVPAVPSYRVMAEYGSSGIWKISTGRGGAFRHGMVEHAALALPSSLAARFVAWIEQYENHNLNGTLDTDGFNGEGLELAIALKGHLGALAQVEYQGESADGGLLETIII